MENQVFAAETEEIVRRVHQLQENGVSPVVIAIDGMAGAGKTTLASLLAAELDGAVVHMDDFHLPQGFRTPERLRTPGGNVYVERFQKEVAPYLRSGVLFGYGVYDHASRSCTENQLVQPKPVIIVEGTYACHPELEPLYDLRLHCKCSAFEQKKRLETLSETDRELYAALWIPMENRYFEAFGTEQQADLVLTSGAPQPPVPLEIERKLLIRMPEAERLRKESARVLDIEQVYLKGAAPGVNVRIRKTTENGAVTYYKTEKRRLSALVREENECTITEQHYKILQGFANPELRPIVKTRYCVPLAGGLTAEIDLFPFWADRAFLEVELPDTKTEFTLPDWIDVIRDVTADKRYTNAALAREIPEEQI